MTPHYPNPSTDPASLPEGVPLPPVLGRELTAAEVAYHERNRLVAAFVRYGVSRGYRAWLAFHESAPGDPPWPAEWRYVVYLELPLRDGEGRPAGQVSWHIHETERPLFGFLRLEKRGGWPRWDGHTTAAKYERLAAYVARFDEFHPPPRRPWWWRFVWKS